MYPRTDSHNSMSPRPHNFTMTTRVSHRPLAWFATIALLVAWLGLGAPDGWAKSKHNPAPRPEPELKILELKISPNPYAPGQSALEFAVTVQLPKELNGATVLEVSSLVSSPSKTSLRFLSDRKPVESLLDSAAPSAQGSGPGEENAHDNLPRVLVILTWDGNDQHRRVAPAGAYDYQVRAKLLTMGEKGARTQMVAWPRRGTLVVK